MRYDQIPVTILGAGYVGQALLGRFPTAHATRRRATPLARTHVFDLDDTGTWVNPPLAGRTVIWTFPAEPLARVQSFHDTCLKGVDGLIVLGSTSAYLLPGMEGESVASLDERAPLDLSQARVQGEEWLRARGAAILQLAGIFGPARDPAGWLRRGRIRDGAKIVNLIHVDDIVTLVTHLLAHPLPGERINVSNGAAAPWRELAARFKQDGRVPADFELPESGPRPHGKRIDNARLRALLPGHEFLQP